LLFYIHNHVQITDKYILYTICHSCSSFLGYWDIESTQKCSLHIYIYRLCNWEPVPTSLTEGENPFPCTLSHGENNQCLHCRLTGLYNTAVSYISGIFLESSLFPSS
jgi:hypothetical protein